MSLQGRNTFEERPKRGFRLSDIAFMLSKKKVEVQTEVIGGKELKVFFTFYSEKDYLADLKEWAEFQVRLYKERERTQKIEGFKIYDEIIREYNGDLRKRRQDLKKPELKLSYYLWLKEKIPYSQFINITVPFLSRIIFQVFYDNPSLFSEREHMVAQLRVQRSPRWEKEGKEWRFASAFPVYGDEGVVYPALDRYGLHPERIKKEGLLDLDHYYLDYSGIYLVEAIVAPKIFMNRIDYQFFYKWFAHAFDNYHNCAMNYYTTEFAFKKGMQPLMRAKRDYTLSFLQSMLHDLRNMGVSDFRKKRDMPVIKIVPSTVKGFRKIVQGLLSQTKKGSQHLAGWYEKNIWTGSMDAVYYCGYLMAFTIAWAKEPQTAKIMIRPNGFKISFNDGKNNNLQDFFRKEKEFFITAPSPAVYASTLAELESLGPYQFLKAYEDAANKLFIGIDNMVMTTEFFKMHWQQAESKFNKKELEKIKKAGYYPVL